MSVVLSEEVLSPFSDGFVTKYSDAPTQIVRYTHKSARSFLSVFEDVLAEPVRLELEDLAGDGKPWGVYVPSAEFFVERVLPEGRQPTTQERRELAAAEAVRALLVRRCALADMSDPAKVDGVAVWCLASGVGASVDYHIDYAELHRYETNEVVPPLYAATLHVADLEADASDASRRIVGGGFLANSKGLQHYRRCGYKGGRLQDESAFDGPGWQRVPYAANRGIVHDGEWPHGSEKVSAVAEGKRRVIIGFNVFGPRVAKVNRRAPEHSDAFNNTVRLYQASARLGSSSSSPMSVEAVKANKPLARLLVGLARTRQRNNNSNGIIIPHPTESEQVFGSEGQQVEAMWRRGLKWWPARVVAENEDGTYAVHYADGTKWDTVPANCLRNAPLPPPVP